MKMDAVKWHPGPFAASATGFDENSDRRRRPFFYHHYHIIKRRFCQMHLFMTNPARGTDWASSSFHRECRMQLQLHYTSSTA